MKLTRWPRFGALVLILLFLAALPGMGVEAQQGIPTEPRQRPCGFLAAICPAVMSG